MAGLKIRDNNGNVQQVLCISGINTLDKRIRLYEPVCTVSGGVVTAPLPEGYDAQTFLEKLVFCELYVNTSATAYCAAVDLKYKAATTRRAMCINSSGSLDYNNAVKVDDSGLHWAFDPYDMMNTAGPMMRMGLL